MDGKKIDLLAYYLQLSSWDAKIDFIERLRKRRRSFTIDGIDVSMKSKKEVLRAFDRDICDYNVNTGLNEPIRSYITGKLLTQNSAQYFRTLRRCGLVRHYSTCREAVDSSQDNYFPHPRYGNPISRTSTRARRIVRRCLKK